MTLPEKYPITKALQPDWKRLFFDDNTDIAPVYYENVIQHLSEVNVGFKTDIMFLRKQLVTLVEALGFDLKDLAAASQQKRNGIQRMQDKAKMMARLPDIAGRIGKLVGDQIDNDDDEDGAQFSLKGIAALMDKYKDI